MGLSLEQLKQIREVEGYTGWLDQDGNKVDANGNLLDSQEQDS